MNMPFDPPEPEKVREAFDRIRDAFNLAAANSSGRPQQLFQSLGDKFEKIITDGQGYVSQGMAPQDVMKKMQPQMMGMVFNMVQLGMEAQRDPQVGETMQNLMETIRTEVGQLIPGGFPGGGFPGFPGGGFPGLPGGGGNDGPGIGFPPPVKKPPQDNNPPKDPKKPGKGNFDF